MNNNKFIKELMQLISKAKDKEIIEKVIISNENNRYSILFNLKKEN
jgi:hypothetical protein